MDADGSDSDVAVDIFQEPLDYFQPEKEHTFVEYPLKNSQKLSLRLVGQSPLWGHLLWQASKVVTSYIEDHAHHLVCDKTVLELGAGSGLPSLVAAMHGAKRVVVTDYPDPDLIQNLNYNIENCGVAFGNSILVARGFLWGDNPVDLSSCLGSTIDGFDLLILADILFNHSEHAKLIKTISDTLARKPTSVALVFFTPYRPKLLDKDLHFFELAKEHGFEVTKILEHIMDKAMFENDPGDEMLRRTVFGYTVKWRIQP